jgi:hypothetical protein
MRKFLFFLLMTLVGCGSDGIDSETVSIPTSSPTPTPTPTPSQHVPEISNLTLSPNYASKMEGDGSVEITAEFAFADPEGDIETLQIAMSDGTRLTIPTSTNAVSGTLTESLSVSTTNDYGCWIEVWVLDEAGDSSNHLSAQFSVHEHYPKISNLSLSPDSALHMQGDGQTVVTAVLEVADNGVDIKTMMVHMSNGTDLSMDVSGLVNDLTGTLTKEFEITTTEVGTLDIEIRLIDAAGDSSNDLTATFPVRIDAFTWLKREAVLPNVLNDVAAMAMPGAGMSYVGTLYTAVGDAGTIMTSEDGITWTAQVSGTDVDLNAVVCTYFWIYGCYVVGDDGTVLYSDNLVDWSLINTGSDDVSLQAISLFGFDGLLAGGADEATDTACIMHGNWFGDPWSKIELTGRSGQHITDIKALFVDDWPLHLIATLEVPISDQGRVLVSVDRGLTWTDVLISDGHESTYSIESYNGFLWAGGTEGRIYSSADGLNWTAHETPAVQSNLVAVSATDSMLIAHGFSASMGMREQVGVVTSDGGETWQTFVIGAAYEPRGLAYGDGRWVSVGQSLTEPGKGAIFTTQ